MWSSLVWAQEAAQNVPKPNFFEQMIPFLLIFVVFYFFLIRPKNKQMKEHQNFLSNMKRGDSVLTSGGILGTIEGLTDQFVTLEVADGVRIRVLKSQVSGAIKEEPKK